MYQENAKYEKIYITGQEVRTSELYKRGSALSSVKKILENPKDYLVDFLWNGFKQIDEDIKQVNVDYINWCRKWKKYQIYFTGNILFNIDYIEKTISF